MRAFNDSKPNWRCPYCRTAYGESKQAAEECAALGEPERPTEHFLLFETGLDGEHLFRVQAADDIKRVGDRHVCEATLLDRNGSRRVPLTPLTDTPCTDPNKVLLQMPSGRFKERLDGNPSRNTTPFRPLELLGVNGGWRPYWGSSLKLCRPPTAEQMVCADSDFDTFKDLQQTCRAVQADLHPTDVRRRRQFDPTPPIRQLPNWWKDYVLWVGAEYGLDNGDQATQFALANFTELSERWLDMMTRYLDLDPTVELWFYPKVTASRDKKDPGVRRTGRWIKAGILPDTESSQHASYRTAAQSLLDQLQVREEDHEEA